MWSRKDRQMRINQGIIYCTPVEPEHGLELELPFPHLGTEDNYHIYLRKAIGRKYKIT